MSKVAKELFNLSQKREKQFIVIIVLEDARLNENVYVCMGICGLMKVPRPYDNYLDICCNLFTEKVYPKLLHDKRALPHKYQKLISVVNYVMNIDTPINSLWLIGKVQM